MNQRNLLAVAILSLSALHAAVAAPGPSQAARAPKVEDAHVDAAAALRRPEPPPVRAVVAPPRPLVETVVQPGLHKIEKHERLTDVLKARKRAGRSDRVTAD
jgi:hypothetical protein